MTVVSGWPSRDKIEQAAPQLNTVNKIGQYLDGMDVRAYAFQYQVGADTVEAGSTERIINATGHLAQPGDVIRFSTGSLANEYAIVQETTSNAIALAQNLEQAPSTGNGFIIYRPRLALVDASGSVQVGGSLSSVSTVEQVNKVTLLETVNQVTRVVDVSSVSTIDFLADCRQPTHDNFNCNANLQIGNSDASDSNPVPVEEQGNVFSSLTHSTLAVSTSSQTALASNSSRQYAYFQNDSDTTVYLFFGATAVASQGIRLNARGAIYEINSENLYTGQVTAIHAGTGTKTLMIGEA